MRHKLPLPSEEDLHSWFAYDPVTGWLHWRIKAAQRVQITDRAGMMKKGRWWIGFPSSYPGVSGGAYAACVIFKMHYGWEPEIVDHDDGDQLNDRLDNLIGTTQTGNVHKSRPRRDRAA